MKAVVYKEKGVFSLEEREVPVIKDPGDAVVRATLCSICSSDIHIKTSPHSINHRTQITRCIFPG